MLSIISICSMAAIAKDQGHGKISLGGEIVETPGGIAGENVDHSVDFGLISMSDAAQGTGPLLIGSHRNV